MSSQVVVVNGRVYNRHVDVPLAYRTGSPPPAQYAPATGREFARYVEVDNPVALRPVSPPPTKRVVLREDVEKLDNWEVERQDEFDKAWSEHLQREIDAIQRRVDDQDKEGERISQLRVERARLRDRERAWDSTKQAERRELWSEEQSRMQQWRELQDAEREAELAAFAAMQDERDQQQRELDSRMRADAGSREERLRAALDAAREAAAEAANPDGARGARSKTAERLAEARREAAALAAEAAGADVDALASALDLLDAAAKANGEADAADAPPPESFFVAELRRQVGELAVANTLGDVELHERRLRLALEGEAEHALRLVLSREVGERGIAKEKARCREYDSYRGEVNARIATLDAARNRRVEHEAEVRHEWSIGLPAMRRAQEEGRLQRAVVRNVEWEAAQVRAFEQRADLVRMQHAYLARRYKDLAEQWQEQVQCLVDEESIGRQIVVVEERIDVTALVRAAMLGVPAGAAARPRPPTASGPQPSGAAVAAAEETLGDGAAHAALPRAGSGNGVEALVAPPGGSVGSGAGAALPHSGAPPLPVAASAGAPADRNLPPPAAAPTIDGADDAQAGSTTLANSASVGVAAAEPATDAPPEPSAAPVDVSDVGPVVQGAAPEPVNTLSDSVTESPQATSPPDPPL